MKRNEQKLKNLKVARVSTVAFFVETQLRQQIKTIAQHGADVTVISSDADLKNNIAGTEYVSVKISRKVNIKRDFLTLLELIKLFKTKKFDIVHSTTPKAGFLCCIAAFIVRIPVRLHTFTGQPWVDFKGVKRKLFLWFDKLICILNTRCYADSESQKQFLVANNVCTEESLRVLGYGSLAGIDLNRFNKDRFSLNEIMALRKKLQIPPGAFVFLFVGRICVDKGIRELIQAYMQLENLEKNIYLLLVGPQEMDLGDVLDKYSEQVISQIKLTGPSDKPEQFMAISDVLVLPSYREGFGTVVIEAAAMGLPCIGSDIYGLSDAITNNESGILIPVKDVNALSVAMSNLADNPDVVKKLGINARERVEHYFSDTFVNELMIKEYENFMPNQNQ